MNKQRRARRQSRKPAMTPAQAKADQQLLIALASFQRRARA